jgi:acetyl-CoA carboxylase biotin carboxylase subunit
VRVLIANRGEIAVRVIRACRDMGLTSVAVYSDCDRAARHVLEADAAEHIGPSEAVHSYLNADAVLRAARRARADAVHPGYGFLAENEAFAAACTAAGLLFIGPSADAIRLMGSKTEARAVARGAGVPVVPGTDGPLPADATADEIAVTAEDVGFPLLVKAVAGGGGKGMRTVESGEALLTAVQTARSEAGAAFGDAAVYLERRIEQPRHVEVQLLADHHGTVVPFVERECSIQRRHQKVVEESPSMAVTPELRQRLASAAARIAEAARYTNAGTIEFLLDPAGHFYFLEMNTRLQVEHPVTEMVTGIDLVRWQIRIARGERLDVDPARALTPSGHAIECRIYAEDPDSGFMPSPGVVRGLRAAAGPGIRDDGGVVAGYAVPVHYDSLVAKLIGWGATRGEAIERTLRALREYEVLGIRTTIPFFLWLLQQPEYREGRYHTAYLDELLAARRGLSFSDASADEAVLVAAAAALYMFERAAAPRGARGGRPAGSGWTQVARREGLRA